LVEGCGDGGGVGPVEAEVEAAAVVVAAGGAEE